MAFSSFEAILRQFHSESLMKRGLRLASVSQYTWQCFGTFVSCVTKFFFTIKLQHLVISYNLH